MPPAIADGSNMSIVVPITLSTPDKLFWRVAVNDVYSNGGNITDYETYQLLVDDGDNNGLFDTWEMTYFGHTGNDPNADPDGDGRTNLLESEYQTNPLDYYNGYTPSVQLLSGSGQRGAPDAILPSPLAISVWHGTPNAPLHIAVTQGGALLSLDSTSGWSASMDTHTTSTFTNAYGTGFPCAKVYIKLPTNTGDVSNITATAGTGTLTASTTAWAAVSDTSLPPPTGLTVIPTGPSTVHLTWIPGDSSQATTIEFSTDGGNTWHTAAIVAAGVSQAIFNGLNPDQAIQFRVLTGGTPTASDGQNPPTFALPNDQTPPITGTIVSPPGTTVTAYPVSAPTLLGVHALAYGIRYGFPGNLTPTTRYLKRETHITTTDTENDGDSGDWTITEAWDDLKTGHGTTTSTGVQLGNDYGGEWTGVSNTTRTRIGIDDDDSGETSTTTETLSMEYTTAMLQSNVESWIPPYPDTFSTNVNTAEIDLLPEPEDIANIYALRKLKYKWRVNSIPGQVVNWLEIFTPSDWSAKIVESKSWTPGTSATESETYEIDPSTKNSKKNGVYEVVPLNVSVSWQAIAGFDNVDAHIDPWTGVSNGQRIFPDFKDPSDTEIRHKLEVIVKTSPALVGKTVYVKSFDVDDTTSETEDKDNEPTSSTYGHVIIDTNGKAGDDNLTDYLGTLKSGHFWTGTEWGSDTTTGIVDANGEAKFIFRVGMQPGNNYRVAASVIDDSMYAGVQVADPGAAKYLGPELSKTGGAPVTPLLTVWRKLWVENDSMEAIPTDDFGYKRNDLNSETSNPTINRVTLNAIGTTTEFEMSPIDDDSNFIFLENGHIVFQSQIHDILRTALDATNSVSIPKVTMEGDYSALPIGSEFRLYDDDDYGLNHAPLPKNDFVDDIIKNTYRPAFIEVIDAVSFNEKTEVDFWVNHPALSLTSHVVWEDAKDLTDTKKCWVGNLIAGYQNESGDDNDPRLELGSEGLTPNFTRRYSIVYVETVRDYMDSNFRDAHGDETILNFYNDILSKNLKLTAAHELGHMPGGGWNHHNEMQLMGDGGAGSNVNGESFSAKTLLRFRTTQKWQQPWN